MFCRKCGKENQDDALFCSQCGQPLNEQMDEVENCSANFDNNCHQSKQNFKSKNFPIDVRTAFVLNIVALCCTPLAILYDIFCFICSIYLPNVILIITYIIGGIGLFIQTKQLDNRQRFEFSKIYLALAIIVFVFSIVLPLLYLGRNDDEWGQSCFFGTIEMFLSVLQIIAGSKMIISFGLKNDK